MEIILQLRAEVAAILHRDRAASTASVASGLGALSEPAAKAAARRLKATFSRHGISFRPIHPDTEDLDLQCDFVIDGDPADARRLLDDLLGEAAVTAAYEKSDAEPAGGF